VTISLTPGVSETALSLWLNGPLTGYAKYNSSSWYYNTPGREGRGFTRVPPAVGTCSDHTGQNLILISCLVRNYVCMYVCMYKVCMYVYVCVRGVRIRVVCMYKGYAYEGVSVCVRLYVYV
jgi:hypothetical protein